MDTTRTAPTPPEPRTPLLGTATAAAFLDYSRRTLEKWRIRGGGPRFVRVSRGSVKYRREDLEAWIAERIRTSTSDQGAA